MTAGVLQNAICEAIQDLRDEHIIELSADDSAGELTAHSELEAHTPWKLLAGAAKAVICGINLSDHIADRLHDAEPTGQVDYTIGLWDTSACSWGQCIPTVTRGERLHRHTTDISDLRYTYSWPSARLGLSERLSSYL